jgi:uncharacterized MnhB-related membrane protein
VNGVIEVIAIASAAVGSAVIVLFFVALAFRNRSDG